MTDDDRNAEGVEESIEDLEAPAGALQDVAGGKNDCVNPTCVGGTRVVVHCIAPTCGGTEQNCLDNTSVVVLSAR